MKIIYIRFGDIPKNESSYNYLTKEYEKGVSVYEALERDDGRISVLFPNLTGGACVSLSAVLDRPMYVVEGDRIGSGSDGEPLLKNCKIVKEITDIHHDRGW